MRLDRLSLLPAVRLAAAGVISMVVGALLWVIGDEEPEADLGDES